MNQCLKLKFDWPGLNKSDLERVSNGFGDIDDKSSSLEWFLPLRCGTENIEIIVRESKFPLQNSADAIYVRSLEDLSHFSTIRHGGGLNTMLSVTDSSVIIRLIESRLEGIRERLADGGDVYIFAAHRNAAKCVHYCQKIGLNVVGFVDNDKSKHGRNYLGHTIFPLDAIELDATIINASGRYCVDINKQLMQTGHRWNIDLMELLFLYDLTFQAEGGFRRYIVDAIDNRLRIASLYLMLADDISRKVFDGIMLFRQTLNSEVVDSIVSPYNEEFFASDLLHFSAGEVFVDGGAYDGDSYLRFSEMAPEFSKVYLFEPDTEICERAQQRVADDERVSVCNYGLWTHTEELRFSSTGGMDGAICDDGDVSIPVVSMDEYIKENVTHIKLDVEGAEEMALMGGGRHIAQSRPSMAIALYHRACDIWKIPAIVEKLGGQYQFSVRHYSHTIDDSIVYAFPIK